MSSSFHVHADWDPDAAVWVATSPDIPGLATEAETVELLTAKLRVVIPELLEANRIVADRPNEISFEIISHRRESIRLAS